jgi:virulence-associated protein VapD
MSNIVRVFIYDELINEKIYKELGFSYTTKYSVTLSAWKRVFNKVPVDNGGDDRLGHANIEPTHDNLGMMIGMVYEMEEAKLAELDRHYQYPDEYDRRILELTRHDFSQTKGYVYIAQKNKIKEDLKPSKEMMKKYRGAKKNFDMLHFSRLMNTPTID